MPIKLFLLVLALYLSNCCDPSTCVCTAQVCSSCVSYRAYFNGTTCIMCDYRCLSCTAQSVCTQCLSSYYLSASTCANCPLFCSSCPGGVCSLCIDGYVVVGGVCQQCQVPNVLKCSSLANVLQCATGYWQNGNSCSLCRQFCLICTSSANCQLCTSGFYIATSSGTYCMPCCVGCLTCTSTACTLCSSNYVLVGGGCASVSCSISECAACADTLTCVACHKNYYLRNNTCIRGSSLLCGNNAVGPMYYQCPCSAITSFEGGHCVPKLWIGGVTQIYYDAYTFHPIAPPQYICGGSAFQTNPLRFTVLFDPYYKLGLFFKMLASGGSGSVGVVMIDSANASFTSSHDYTGDPCSAFYFNLSSNSIKQRLVQLTITSQAALSELVIQIYRCSPDCEVCYNSQYCMTCVASLFVSNKICVQSCNGFLELYLPTGDPSNYTSKMCVAQCAPGFYIGLGSNSAYMCLLCSGNCSTCLSSTQCLSCVAPGLYFLGNFSCLAVCPATHYNLLGVCTPCAAPCKTCNSPDNCTSCSVGLLLQYACVGICPNGTYANNVNLQCSPCEGACLSCSFTPNYCLSCVIGYVLLGSNCLVSCPVGVYYQLKSVCISCMRPCMECLSELKCSSCATGYLLNLTCFVTCPKGYYSDVVTGHCLLCVNNCLTCSSATTCLRCNNGTSLMGEVCVLSCPSRTFQLNSVCVTCVQPCLTCSSAVSCLTCAIGYLSAHQPICLSVCEAGYYAWTNNLTCLACSSLCAKCAYISNNCIECLPPLNLQYNTCVSQCSSGFYETGGNCVICSYPCSKCVGSPSNCTSCLSPYILYNSNCNIQCASTYFLNGSVCSPCKAPCNTCSSAAICLTCVGTYLLKGVCLSTCPSTYYADGATLACRGCVFPCLACINSSSCLSCASGYFNAALGTCSICASGSYADEATRHCLACAISNCGSCISAAVCTGCLGSYLLFNSNCVTQGVCVTILGHFVSGNTCAQCISPCADCLNYLACTSCAIGYVLQGAQCVFACSDGSYLLNSTRCIPCSTNCATCILQTVCLSCVPNSSATILLVSNSTCVNQCAITSYLDLSFGYPRCLVCTPPCLQCVSATACLRCTTGVLYDSSCKFSCPSGYYSNSSGICLLCDAICLQCDLQPQRCVSCLAPLYLEDQTCVSVCKATNYLSELTNSCSVCIGACLTCTSAAFCLSCANSTLILYQGDCLLGCPDGTYSSLSGCTPCPAQCQLCMQTNSSLSCLRCLNNLYMWAGNCIPTCLDLSYGDTLTLKCYSCIPPCLSCTSAISCSSCVTGYLLYQTQCLRGSTCPDQSFLLGSECVGDCLNLWSNMVSRQCEMQCPRGLLQVPEKRACTAECPLGYYLSWNYTCLSCTDAICSSLLSVKVIPAVIFNQLYLRLQFTDKFQGSISNQTCTIYLDATSTRVLQEIWRVEYSLEEASSNGVWLNLAVGRSMSQAEIEVQFSDYYVFPGMVLQRLRYFSPLTDFDAYSAEGIAGATVFTTLGKLLAIVMVLSFAVNLLLNTGFLSYPVIDYYQLLFLLLFLPIDYPPVLNSFFYPFKYSHYLFLPEIFAAATYPDFYLFTSDYNFLNQTGHDFLILIVAVAVLLLAKTLQIILLKVTSSNKIENQGDSESQDAKKSESQDAKKSESQDAKKSEFSKQSEEGRQPVERRVVSRCAGWVKGVIDRFKWNYINDVTYSVYLFVMLAAFSQSVTFSDFTANALSNILAVLFMMMALLIPMVLAYVLSESRLAIQEESYRREQGDVSREEKILTEYKCFVYSCKTKVSWGYYSVPLRYLRKLFTVLLLAYLKAYPTFVLGFLIMLTSMSAFTALTLQPYKLTFENYFYASMDILYVFVLTCISILHVYTFTLQQKVLIGYITVAACLLLAGVLAFHNVLANIAEITKWACGKDFMRKYEAPEYATDTNPSESGKELHTQQQPENEGQNEGQNEVQIISQSSDGLDIYLRNESTAPPILIKCTNLKSCSEKAKAGTQSQMDRGKQQNYEGDVQSEEGGQIVASIGDSQKFPHIMEFSDFDD